MTDFFKRLLNQPEPPAAPDVPPAEMAAYLRSLDDRQWGRYAFSREPLEGKFTPQQKDAYTAAANACGAEWADKLAAEHDTRDPLTLCGELGLKLKTPATPAGGGQVLFAQFVQPDEITIFTDCLDKAETLGGLLPARAKLQGIILATPPAALISAGIRSNAITAHAPAASAVFACSAFVTSMMTPPFNICASSRFNSYCSFVLFILLITNFLLFQTTSLIFCAVFQTVTLYQFLSGS